VDNIGCFIKIVFLLVKLINDEDSEHNNHVSRISVKLRCSLLFGTGIFIAMEDKLQSWCGQGGRKQLL